MVAAARKIVISGYYGFNNSGDEAVLKSILTALEQESQAQQVPIEPIVLSIDPELTHRLYGVQAVPRMDIKAVVAALRGSHGLISGGGSLLQDATGAKTIPYYLAVIKIAQWLRKPTFIYSQGVGPVQRRLFYPMIRHVFKKCAYISVRDVESAGLLQEMGVPQERIDVVPDPVMGMPLPHEMVRDAEEFNRYADEEGLELPIVGISVRFWNSDRSELDGLARALTMLCAERAVHLRFLPFHLPSDEEASRYVIERLGNVASGGSVVSVSEPTEQPQEMLAEVSRCQLLLGMRLHSLIYAASQRVPIMGISYDPKIDHFLHRLDLNAAGTTNDIHPQMIAAEAIHLLDHHAAWQQEKEERIAALVEQSGRPAGQIVQYFRTKG